ncbi:hypothetical protein [Streptomyces shenzhenensis]|uniref:hypothetical protein n=1 Tax=Streptomyces shenzhenensis TaxID=943815 RepID=UPI0015F0E171|nr:hypothetical protein [Streptomyces shenzhenensis]
MPTYPLYCGRACTSADDINEAIRNLMSQPASPERSEQWARLLEQWADACPTDGSCWATAA